MAERNPSERARRQREERMRYEVLRMLYDAAGGHCDADVHAWTFVTDLGVWREELFRVIEYLDRRGFVEYRGAGPVVRITPAGCAYLETDAGRRRSIRD